MESDKPGIESELKACNIILCGATEASSRFQ